MEPSLPHLAGCIGPSRPQDHNPHPATARHIPSYPHTAATSNRSSCSSSLVLCVVGRLRVSPDSPIGTKDAPPPVDGCGTVAVAGEVTEAVGRGRGEAFVADATLVVVESKTVERPRSLGGMVLERRGAEKVSIPLR